jgi:hypothetical protein
VSKTSLTFLKQNHFWIDSGLWGLNSVLERIQAINTINVITNDYGLELNGTENEIQVVLENAYEYLIENYYNLSSKKQKEDTQNYNFFYDSEKDKFIAFPKRKTYGIADIIYNKAPRPSVGEIKWIEKTKREIEINGKKLKKNRGVLPKEYSHLQKILISFLMKMLSTLQLLDYY